MGRARSQQVNWCNVCGRRISDGVLHFVDKESNSYCLSCAARAEMQKDRKRLKNQASKKTPQRPNYIV